MADDRGYRILVSFDAEKETFFARVPELGVKANGPTRAEAMASAETEIERQVEGAATEGAALPDPVDGNSEAGEVTIKLAAALYRDLTYHARLSNASPADLATQLLAKAIGGLDGNRPAFAPRARPAQEAAAAPQRDDDRGRGRGRQGGRGNREGYRPDVENQANFLEYVRSMEKGGGGNRGGGNRGNR